MIYISNHRGWRWWYCKWNVLVLEISRWLLDYRLFMGYFQDGDISSVPPQMWMAKPDALGTLQSWKVTTNYARRRIWDMTTWLRPKRAVERSLKLKTIQLQLSACRLTLCDGKSRCIYINIYTYRSFPDLCPELQQPILYRFFNIDAAYQYIPIYTYIPWCPTRHVPVETTYRRFAFPRKATWHLLGGSSQFVNVRR